MEETRDNATLPRPGWLDNLELLWSRRVLLARVAVCAFIVSAAFAFLIPRQYTSSTRIMPPDQPSTGTALLAALAGRAQPGPLGGLAGSLLGMHNTGSLFVDLLRSDSVTGGLVDRYDLQRVYGKRYRVDTEKKLTHRTEITDDKKSGVITITVSDTDPRRAQEMAQSYLDQLNRIVARVNTSSARREREFIEQRLVAVEGELIRAEKALSEFSGKNAAIDIKEQTRALVDAGAKVQAGLIVEQTQLESLRQIYGDDNFRVRASEARIATLRGELKKMSGTQDDPVSAESSSSEGELYPPLRQLPQLGEQWANLYRNVRIHEAVYELLSSQYEAARIDEAKEIPVVSVIDPPAMPEKKSFPPRAAFALAGASLGFLGTSLLLLLGKSWHAMEATDPRRGFVLRVAANLREHIDQLRRRHAREAAQ